MAITLPTIIQHRENQKQNKTKQKPQLIWKIQSTEDSVDRLNLSDNDFKVDIKKCSSNTELY